MGAGGGAVPWRLSGKEPICQTRDLSLIPGLERPPGKEMATHFSILALEIPWIVGAWQLQSRGRTRVRQEVETKQ